MTQAKTESKPTQPRITCDQLALQAWEISECARAAGKFEDALAALDFIAGMQSMGPYANPDRV